MIKLGVSIYPEHSTLERDFAYLELAASYGFTSVFTCLLSAKKSKEELLKLYQTIANKVHELGMELMVDASPQVIQKLGGSPLNLRIFQEIGIDCIRLDMSFGPLLDTMITQNQQKIRIAFNGSADAGVELLLAHGAKQEQMEICHNFYPQPYTGLDIIKFRELNERWYRAGLSITAFITSRESPTFGPWPVSYGLCTLEESRTLSLQDQLRHMMMEKHINRCMIGNAYASEAELSACAQAAKQGCTVLIAQEPELSTLEKRIVYGMQHQGRYDCGTYMIRSIFPRLTIGKETIEPRPCDKEYFEAGEVLIVNSNLMHYQGEVQIVMERMKNLGIHNRIGKVGACDVKKLSLLKEERVFCFQSME